MKIAQIAGLAETVPPAKYGGTERVMGWLIDTLVDKGHDVTLFACSGSGTKANLRTFRDQPVRTDPELSADIADLLVMLKAVKESAEEFDIIHVHIDFFHYPHLKHVAHKVLTTLHGRQDMKGLHNIYKAYPDFGLITISDKQGEPIPDANILRTVQHGMPKDLLTPNYDKGQEYVAFLGRFAEEKNPVDAIKIAKQSGYPLKMAAKICTDSPTGQAFFDDNVAPHIDGKAVQFIGEISDHEKSEFLGNAKALLLPIVWDEPFGLVMIEAMACGTPVIAYKRGSVPEILEDGVTGFIVETKEEAIEALKKIDTLDRRIIRQEFEKRFTADIMVENYLKIYNKMLHNN